MSKKTAKKKSPTASGPSRETPAGAVLAGEKGGSAAKSGWLWILAAVLIVSGYAMLKKVDPGGTNGWAVASPAFLLSGYLLIIPAIIRTYRG